MEDAATYRVTIEAKGSERFTKDVPAGSQGLEFILSQAGSLAGSVYLDEGIAVHQLWFQLSSPGIRNVYIRPEQSMTPGLYTFKCDGEVGPAYQFVARTRMHDELFTLDGITLLPGQLTEPPALQPLDLRGRLKGIHCKVQDSDGNLMEANYTISKGNRNSGSSIDAGGETFLTADEGFEKVEFRANGFRPVTLQNVITDQVVTMEKALSFVLRMPQELARYRGMRYGFKVSQEGVRQPLSTGDFNSRGKSKSAVYVPGPGNYLARVHFFAPAPESDLGFTPGFFTSVGEFPIYVSKEGDVITLPIDQALLDASLGPVDEESD